MTANKSFSFSIKICLLSGVTLTSTLSEKHQYYTFKHDGNVTEFLIGRERHLILDTKQSLRFTKNEVHDHPTSNLKVNFQTKSIK